MKNRFTFYLFIAALVVLDSVLLRSPNLLGKIGLIIYKYHYLRTFPKALLTVSLVVVIVAIIAEGVRFLVKRKALTRMLGKAILLGLTLLVTAALIKTMMDFTTWSYSHTGLRFRIGAHLLPAILITVLVYAFITLPQPEADLPADGTNGDAPNTPI
jgi:hypothetical protein